MKFSDRDLQQIDGNWLDVRSPVELLHVSKNLLDDLKEARERLNQNSANSSIPSGSEPAWYKPSDDDDDEEEETLVDAQADKNDDDDKSVDDKSVDDKSVDDKNDSSDTDSSTEPNLDKEANTAPSDEDTPRKAGRQPGSQGFGRTQVLPITETKHHHAEQCSGCGHAFTEETSKRAYTGFYTIDIEYGAIDKPGIQVTNTLHRYYDSSCECCGHSTRMSPHREPPEALYDNIELTEWRLVGAGLMSLIVFLQMRTRMSRPRIREYLRIWLGIELSVGTINQCIHESGRSISPVEEQLIREILDSDLMHADETTWLIDGKLYWLWVFISSTTALYYITHRTNELVRNFLVGNFKGWLMSDGYCVYRELEKRLRCWAHLERKANGIAESLDKDAAEFGKKAQNVIKTLMDAIYLAREGPGNENLETQYEALLADFKQTCEHTRKHCTHKKARALAVEFLNDWEAIFIVLRHPHLPLTNNAAERALRHWVIMRKLSYGTRTDEGTRVFTLLASVIDTCRLRNISPWRYLEQVIGERRSGRDAPPLPDAVEAES